MKSTCDVFVSYAREDQHLASILVEALGREDWTAFWDVDIAAGSKWSDELERRLMGAKCVLVLWTTYSIVSDFVKHEASVAAHDRKLLQAVVAGCRIPAPFEGEQAVVLRLDGLGPDRDSLDALLRSVAERLGPRNPVVTLPTPKDFERLNADHLALVHSSWRRRDKDEEFGARMYQIHVILLGQPAALNRVEHVTYHLDPAYPMSTYSRNNRRENFGFYELANGYSMIRATVKVRGQSELVELSRFINLSETGPRLAMFYDTQEETAPNNSIQPTR
jgi:hypothetical protein